MIGASYNARTISFEQWKLTCVNSSLFQTISSRFYPYSEIETDGVFSLDEDALLTTDEVS